jgi:hypothetical protein
MPCIETDRFGKQLLPKIMSNRSLLSNIRRKRPSFLCEFRSERERDPIKEGGIIGGGDKAVLYGL